jgi:hypothetical protein
MTIADQARNAAITLEAKKDALAQRQHGDWKVSFTVQGLDMDPRLTQAAMGTRYAMVLVEIGDDELPVPAKESIAKASAPPPKPAGAKSDWRGVQPAAQAGIRCGEPTFAAFLREEYPEDFRALEYDPAETVRFICGVNSRVELGTKHAARTIWHQLDTQYQAWLAKERVRT